MVAGDVRGDLLDVAARLAPEVDLLLIDLIDERGGVIATGGGYVTKLAELWSAGGRAATRGGTHVAFGTDEHFALWAAAVDAGRRAPARARSRRADRRAAHPLGRPARRGRARSRAGLDDRAGASPTRQYARYFEHLSRPRPHRRRAARGPRPLDVRPPVGAEPVPLHRQAYEFLAAAISGASAARTPAPGTAP